MYDKEDYYFFFQAKNISKVRNETLVYLFELNFYLKYMYEEFTIVVYQTHLFQ